MSMQVFSELNSPAPVGCILQAYGTGFDSNIFLRDSTIDKDRIIFSGKLNSALNAKSMISPEADPFLQNYLLIRISEKESNSLQFSEAVDFFNKHGEEIQRLREVPGVEMITLKFQPSPDADPLEFLPVEIESLGGKFVDAINY